MPLSFSHLAIMVLDANFINIPTRQLAGFLFFILLHKEDAKKTDDSVMKVRGCIIDVHEDINNLPPPYQATTNGGPPHSNRVAVSDHQLGKVDY